MGWKIKPKRITFHIDIETDNKGDYKLFGQDLYLCTGCRRTKEGLKNCFIEQMIMLMDEYGIGDDSKMDKGALELRKRIRDMVKVEDI